MQLRQREQYNAWLLAIVPTVFVGLVLLAPALRLVQEGFSQIGLSQGGGNANLWFPWTDNYLRGRMVWSLAQAAITCVLALLLGVPIGWVLARLEFWGRGWVLRLLMLPFVVPTLVAALGVLALFGPSGWLHQMGGGDLQGTPWLLLYGNLFFNLCVVIRATVDGLMQISASRLAAARTLGATPWRAFWRVEWPALLPWLASALCLVFLYCLSGFGLALVLGGQAWGTVEVEIYTLVAHELQLGQASVLGLWMCGLTGAAAWAYAAIEQHAAVPMRPDPIAAMPPRGSGQHLLLGAAMLVLVITCAAPLLAIVWRALLAWQQGWQVLLEEETWAALWNTLRFTTLAVLMAGVLGVLHALAAQRSVVFRAAAYLPFVVSPVLVAFGLLLLYPSWTASLGLLLAAYALLAYPFVAKSLAAALDSMPTHYLEAARTLGAGPWRVFWRVQLPLLAPALRRGLAFAAATAVGEFAVTLFLSRPEWATLTTLIYQHLGRPGAAHLDAAYVLSSLLMGLALLAFLLIDHAGAASPGDSHA